MLAKIKKVKLEPEGKNPQYTALLECPLGNELYVKFDYTYASKAYRPLEVAYQKKRKGARLAWYTNKVENMTIALFLDEIAGKINKKYNFELNK